MRNVSIYIVYSLFLCGIFSVQTYAQEREFYNNSVYGNIALRFEKDRFVGRIGVGNLELLHLSLGFNF